MKKAGILCAVLVLLGTGLAYAESSAGSAAAALPAEVVAFAEVSDLLSAETKFMDLVLEIAPQAMPPTFTERMPEDVFRTMDPVAVDMAKPFQVLVLAPPLHHEPVFVFSVTDGTRYLDSLVPDLVKDRDEGGVHVYTRGQAQPGGVPQGRPVAIGIEGSRAALGRNVQAVQKALALMKAGSFSEQAVFQGSDAGGMVRLKTLLGAMDAEGGNPFNAARMMGGQFGGMGGPPGMNMGAMVKAYVDAAEGMALQMETVSARVSVSKEAVTAAFAVQPVAGSRLAKFTKETAGGEPELLRYMPADAMFMVATRIGDLSPLVDWYGRVLEAMAPGSTSGAGKGLLELARQSVACMGDEIAFSVSSSGEGPLLMTSAVKVKDVQAMERLLEELPGRMAELRDVQKQFGVTTNTKVTPNAIMYNGVAITETEQQYEFHPQPGPFGAMMAAQQKAAMTAFWGMEVKGYSAFKGDTFLYTQGAGALDALKAMLDGTVKAAAGSEQMAAALQGMPRGPVAAGYMSLQDLGGFAMRMIGMMTSQMRAQMQGQPGQPTLDLPSAQFEEAPPVGFAGWVTEDGTVERQVRVPVQAVRSLVQGFQQLNRPQEPFMMQP